MKLFTKSNAADAKLGVVERSAYMLGKMGTAFINTVIATFIMVYYTDVLYLNPGIIASLLLASRVFDGVTDIVMGMILAVQKSAAVTALQWCFSWLPAIFCALSAVFMLFYDLDKKYPQIKKELDVRRGITIREEIER